MLSCRGTRPIEWQRWLIGALLVGITLFGSVADGECGCSLVALQCMRKCRCIGRRRHAVGLFAWTGVVAKVNAVWYCDLASKAGAALWLRVAQ